GDCPGTAVATGSASAFASSGISIHVPKDSNTSWRVVATDTAGNSSSCSNAKNYVNDSTAPAAPTLDALPTTPSDSNDVTITGSASDAQYLTIYATDDCSGTDLGTIDGEDIGDPGFDTTVGNDTTTHFTATATDNVGNVSGCSNAVTYIEDSSAPT